MTIHTFLACDTCNQLGIRNVEQRRGGQRNNRLGRRVSDGRAWFTGDEPEAEAHGWLILPGGQHICPDCHRRGLHKKLASAR